MKRSPVEYAGTFAAPTDEPEVTLESIAETMRELEAKCGPLPKRPGVPTYRFASVTIGGVELDAGAISWSYRPKAPPPSPGFLFRGAETYTASCTFTIPMPLGSWRKFVRALTQPRRFVLPLATLLRRASFGGRKGRRALRRALARGDHEWSAMLSTP